MTVDCQANDEDDLHKAEVTRIRFLELLVEIRIVSLKSERIHRKADKDRRHSRLHNFHGNGGSDESQQESQDPTSEPQVRDKEESGHATDDGTDNGSHEGSQSEHPRDDVVVDDCFQSVRFDERESVFRCPAISLAVNGNLSEGVDVEILQQAFQDGQQAIDNRHQNLIATISKRSQNRSDRFEKRHE